MHTRERNEKWDDFMYTQGWNDKAWLKLPPTHHSNSSPGYNYLQTIFTNYRLFVVSECVWFEKWFATRGTHQLHPQAYLAHMCTDGDMWGWWPLFATFNLASIHSLDAPNWIQRDCMLVGRASSEAGEAAGEAVSDACSIICVADSDATCVTLVGSWGGRQETVVEGSWQAFLEGGWPEDMGGVL